MSSTSLPRDDSLPVANEEFLIRRIPNAPDQFDYSNRIPRLNAFLPTKNDLDGLSLNREDFINAGQLLAFATNENVRQNGGVVAVLAGDVRMEKMVVNPNPAATPGHVIIPEINRTEYDKKEADGSRPGKDRIIDLADKLARRAVVRIHPKAKQT